MDGKVVKTIGAWSRGDLDDQAMLQVLEVAQSDIDGHKTGFDQAVGGLDEQQLEACRELADFAFELLEALESALLEVKQGVESGDRNLVFAAGDEISRASYQLDQTFIAFRNEALRALGPTEVPNLNQLIALRQEIATDSGSEWVEALGNELQSELELARQALGQLQSEPELDDVATLKDTFVDHLRALKRLSTDLATNGCDADFDAHFGRLGKTYGELNALVPKVQMSLRGHGPSQLPDINHLLKLIEAAAAGEVGDAPLMEALEGVEMSFAQTTEALQASLHSLTSELAKEEVTHTLASLDSFSEGVGLVYDFLDERELDKLIQGRDLLSSFAKAFEAHQERLRELENQQGKVVCPRCSTANDSQRGRCGQCGFPLPQNVAASAQSTFETGEGQPPSDFVIHQNLANLYVLINGVAAGTEEVEALVQEVERLDGIISRNLDRLPEEPNDSEPVARAYDALGEGVEKLQQALDLLYQYAESPEQTLLEQAVVLLDAGGGKVGEAAES